VPVFFQQQINETTRLGVWKIEEGEEFFKGNVPVHRDVTHPHKRLQHLAGRFLLQYLFPDFPYDLIRIADTKKPFLPRSEYQFSISHCGDYAAAIVSRDRRVGIDIEIARPLVEQLVPKFLSDAEKEMLSSSSIEIDATIFWSVKEAVFKWHGAGAVDFRQHTQIKGFDNGKQSIGVFFSKNNTSLEVHYRQFEQLVLAWVTTPADKND
jgi:phosphopantetheinyl transferase